VRFPRGRNARGDFALRQAQGRTPLDADVQLGAFGLRIYKTGSDGKVPLNVETQLRVQ
jgi:hypothetical protein